MKNLKSIHFLSVLGLVALIVPTLGIASQSKAEAKFVCSAATILGDYGFQDTGTRKSGNNSVFYDAVRTANFDGKGNHVGKGFLSIDGEFVEYTVKAKYVVNSDCTFTLDGTQTYKDGRPSQAYKQFGVVIRGGKEILELQTTEKKNQAGKYQRIDNY